MAGRYGGKWLFGLGVLCTTILTLLTPLAAKAGVGWLMAVRVMEGIGEVSVRDQKMLSGFTARGVTPHAYPPYGWTGVDTQSTALS